MKLSNDPTGPVAKFECADGVELEVSDNWTSLRDDRYGQDLFISLDDGSGMAGFACDNLPREEVEKLHEFIGHWLTRTGPFA